jgi:hypothetical protein
MLHKNLLAVRLFGILETQVMVGKMYERWSDSTYAQRARYSLVSFHLETFDAKYTGLGNVIDQPGSDIALRRFE